MQTFNNVTNDVWQCLVAKAHSNGIDITTNTGSASKLGVKIAWTYDPAAQTLQLQAVKTGLFGCSTINNGMHEIVTGCYTSAGAAMSAILDH